MQIDIHTGKNKETVARLRMEQVSEKETERHREKRDRER